MQYHAETQAATRPNNHPDHHTDLARDDFARQLTLSVLGHRHAWALDPEIFVDRAPDSPRLLAGGRVAP